MRRHTYAVMSERQLWVVRLNHELGYNLLRGGHTRSVVALYACGAGRSDGAVPAGGDTQVLLDHICIPVCGCF